MGKSLSFIELYLISVFILIKKLCLCDQLWGFICIIKLSLLIFILNEFLISSKKVTVSITVLLLK